MLVNLFPEEDLRVGHFSQASLSNSEEQNHHQSTFSPLLSHVLPEQSTPGRVPDEYLTPLYQLLILVVKKAVPKWRDAYMALVHTETF